MAAYISKEWPIDIARLNRGMRLIGENVWAMSLGIVVWGFEFLLPVVPSRRADDINGAMISLRSALSCQATLCLHYILCLNKDSCRGKLDY